MAARPWKRSVISRASITLASFWLRPLSTAARTPAISSSERNDSKAKYFHISVSLIDSTLANMLLAGSEMPT